LDTEDSLVQLLDIWTRVLPRQPYGNAGILLLVLHSGWWLHNSRSFRHMNWSRYGDLPKLFCHLQISSVL